MEEIRGKDEVERQMSLEDILVKIRLEREAELKQINRLGKVS